MHQASGHCTGQWLSGGQGLLLVEGRAHPTAPAREVGRLGTEVKVRPESKLSKPIVMRQVCGHGRKSVHGPGLGFGSTGCMARHGSNATQHGPGARAAQMQLPREGGWEGWGGGGVEVASSEASSNLSTYVSFSTTL